MEIQHGRKNFHHPNIGKEIIIHVVSWFSVPSVNSVSSVSSRFPQLRVDPGIVTTLFGKRSILVKVPDRTVTEFTSLIIIVGFSKESRGGLPDFFENSTISQFQNLFKKTPHPFGEKSVMRNARVLPLLAMLLIMALPAAKIPAGDRTLDALPFGEFPPAGDSLFPSSPDSLFFAGAAKKDDGLLGFQITSEKNTVKSGTPTRLLLILDHKPGAYSYWTNPGGPGVATKVKWTLPPGFSVSGPEWPTPQQYENGGMTFYVYKGKVALVYTLNPPEHLEEGADVEIKGEIDTQVCTTRSCMPLKKSASAKMVAAAPAKGSPENPSGTSGELSSDKAGDSVAAALAALPLPPRKWRFEAADFDGELVLDMHPEDDSNDDPGALYFFDSTAKPFVDSQKAQKAEKVDGKWRLRLPRLPGPPREGENLTGIVTAENGWLKGENAPAAFALNLPINCEGAGIPPGAELAVERRAWVLLGFAFLGGLLLNVMPCVFPVIGLKIMGFAKQAHKERRAVFLHGLAYTAGVLICFWTLSFLVITMGRGWGAQLQSDWFLFALCYIFIIMSMNMAGVFDIGTGVSSAGQSLSGSEGLKRSFFTGLLATLTSTPCSAPFLGTALAYALSLPPLMSLGVFTVMGLGFSLPYLALSMFPNWLKKLPKPGPWMDTFRQAMCFPLFATTAYLFWTMEAMMEEWRFLMLLFGLVLTAMACWLYGKMQKAELRRPRMAKWLFGCAVAALAVGVYLGMPKASDDLKWEEWSPETVAMLRNEGRPVFIDFTARWCATCQVNKRVYSNDELRGLIKDKNVALLKADWTQYDERITSTLRNEFDKAAVPVNVLYAPGTQKAQVLPDILTVENVGSVLRTLP